LRGRRGGRLRLSLVSEFDPWGSPLCTCPFKYSLNPYTGCSIGCSYCYATAYIGLKPSTPKKSFEARLLRDVARLPPGAIVNLGTSSDPYPPEEAELGLTRRALELLLPRGFRVLVTTKGTLYADRDLGLLSSGNAAVTPTITMLDDGLSRLLEPGAPPPGERLSAVGRAVDAGVPAAVRLDPVIPYVNDDPAMLEELVARIAEAGARMVVTSTYKARPDNLARMRSTLGPEGEKLYRLYREKGVKVQGYTYLPEDMRKRLLEPVRRAAHRHGLEFATCREGAWGRDWFTAGSCDGSHLIPVKVQPGRGAEYKRLTDYM